MVKGTQRQMILVRSPDSELFETAIFVLRDEALRDNTKAKEEVLRQARQAAERYLRENDREEAGRKRGYRAPLAAICGGCVAGVVWLAVHLLGLSV